MDTARDYRILVAEDAISRLERRIKNWGLPWPINRRRVLDEVAEIRKSLLKLKYSYLPIDMILGSEELKVIVDNARSIAGEVLPKSTAEKPKTVSGRLALAEIRYALSILVGLPLRLKLGEENKPEYAVDVLGVEVTRVEDLTENLKVTRASAGTVAFTIVTNIKNMRVGEVRAAAILPPVEFHGVISEAMYSSDPIEERYVGKRVPSRLLHGELASMVIRIVDSVTRQR